MCKEARCSALLSLPMPPRQHPPPLHVRLSPPLLQGHTSAVLGTCFLPGRADQLLCCSADRQIRHLNVTKGAVRPYLVHSDRVRAVVPLDTRGCRLVRCLGCCCRRWDAV